MILIKDDKCLTILSSDETGDLEILENEKSLANTQWASGSLYDDANDALRLEFEGEDDSNVLLFLLTASGGLHVSHRFSLSESPRLHV